MKKLLPLLFLGFSVTYSFSQATQNSTFLIVSFKTGTNDFVNKSFVYIYAEKGNPNASELYALKEFVNKKKKEDDPIYSKKSNAVAEVIQKKDSMNYFNNTTEAINFLASKGWFVQQVFQNISSKPDYEYDGERRYFTKINAEAVFLLRKML
jgi:hypothetical protein